DRAGDGTHDAARVPDGDVEDLFETQRGVDRGSHRQEKRRTIAGATFVFERLLQPSRHASHAHEGDRQQDHRDDEQHRGDQKNGRYIGHGNPPRVRTCHRVTPRGVRLIPAIPAMLARDLEPISFDDLPLGGEWTTRRRTISETEVALFSAVAGDFSPLAIDVAHAGARFAPPALLVAVAIGLGTMDMPVPSVAEWEWLNWKFPRPVKAGETIYARWTLTQKRPPVGAAPTVVAAEKTGPPRRRRRRRSRTGSGSSGNGPAPPANPAPEPTPAPSPVATTPAAATSGALSRVMKRLRRT